MKKLLLSLVSLSVIGAAGDAAACSCAPPPAPLVALSRSSSVFLGTVKSIVPTSDQHGFRQLKVTLDVERVWKGAKSSKAEVITSTNGASCGFHFQSSNKYLVYTHTTNDGRLATSLCSRTRLASQATEDLAALGAGEAPEAVTDSTYFTQDRSYAHDLFPTPEACAEARKKFPGINCQQRVRFRTNGTATIMVTDIMNIATYVIEGNKVLVTVRPGELSGTLTFTLSADGRTLTGPNGTVWKLETR